MEERIGVCTCCGLRGWLGDSLLCEGCVSDVKACSVCHKEVANPDLFGIRCSTDYGEGPCQGMFVMDVRRSKQKGAPSQNYLGEKIRKDLATSMEALTWLKLGDTGNPVRERALDIIGRALDEMELAGKLGVLVGGKIAKNVAACVHIEVQKALASDEFTSKRDSGNKERPFVGPLDKFAKNKEQQIVGAFATYLITQGMGGGAAERIVERALGFEGLSYDEIMNIPEERRINKNFQVCPKCGRRTDNGSYFDKQCSREEYDGEVCHGIYEFEMRREDNGGIESG